MRIPRSKARPDRNLHPDFGRLGYYRARSQDIKAVPCRPSSTNFITCECKRLYLDASTEAKLMIPQARLSPSSFSNTNHPSNQDRTSIDFLSSPAAPATQCCSKDKFLPMTVFECFLSIINCLPNGETFPPNHGVSGSGGPHEISNYHIEVYRSPFEEKLKVAQARMSAENVFRD